MYYIKEKILELLKQYWNERAYCFLRLLKAISNRIYFPASFVFPSSYYFCHFVVKQHYLYRIYFSCKMLHPAFTKLFDWFFSCKRVLYLSEIVRNMCYQNNIEMKDATVFLYHLFQHLTFPSLHYFTFISNDITFTGLTFR